MKRLDVLGVFLAVCGMQLWLVAAAGTDVPFYDQWDFEGRWLYPTWRDGSFGIADLLHPANEHRIAWTLALDLALFRLNGQWDPLVQLVANALLRATCAAGLAWWLGRGLNAKGQSLVATGLVFLFLPHLAWHNALWGFESQVYFALGFSVLALAWLGTAPRNSRQRAAGLAAGLAGLLAMSPAALVAVPLLGLTALHAIEHRRIDRETAQRAWPALLLLGVAFMLQVPVPPHQTLHASSAAQFASAAGRMLAWPHVGQPWAAIVMVLPFTLAVGGRALRLRTAAPKEDTVLLFGGWGLAVALATGWMRGGSDELAAGVPSRYVDFLAPLLLANAYCTVVLVREASQHAKARARLLGLAWAAFLLVGWVGLSAETMRRIILPRARDPLAPVRLVQAFQRTKDPVVFTGQPRLLVPHPDPAVVRQVLEDPRLQGSLPPSLQPDRPMGPLSRAVRQIVGEKR